MILVLSSRVGWPAAIGATRFAVVLQRFWYPLVVMAPPLLIVSILLYCSGFRLPCLGFASTGGRFRRERRPADATRSRSVARLGISAPRSGYVLLYYTCCAPTLFDKYLIAPAARIRRRPIGNQTRSHHRALPRLRCQTFSVSEYLRVNHPSYPCPRTHPPRARSLQQSPSPMHARLRRAH